MTRLRTFAPRAVATTAVALVLLLALAPAAARAQVLNQVPDDALLVFKVKNLKAVSDKIAALAQQFGVAGMSPAMADPLGAIQQESGITQGLNPAGDVAVFIPNTAEFDSDDPPVVMLWPVSDYQAFLKNFADAQTEGEVSQFTMGTNPQPSFSAKWGDYAAVSQNRELVAAKPANLGLKPSGAAAKELDARDFTFFGNIKVLRAKAIPALQENREKILAEIEQGMQQGGQQVDPKYKPVAKAAVNQMIAAAEAFLRDADAATYGIQLSDTGINTTALADFQPGSYLGQQVAKLKGSGDPLVTGLPAAKYLFFGGSAINPEVASTILTDLVGPIEKELAGIGAEGQSIQKYIDAAKAYVKAGKDMRFGMVAPEGQLGQESLIQMVTVINGDAKQIIASQKDMVESQEEMMAAFGQKAPVKTTYAANAKTVEGVQFDQFKTTIEGQPQTPQEQQAAQMLAMMYGPEGMSAYVGAIDDDTVVTVAGGTDALLSAAIKSAKANDPAVAKQDQVQAVAKELPTDKIVALYVPLDQLVTTGVTYANQFGMPVQLQLPEGLPPLGFAATADGSALRLDGHVPAQLVQSLIAAGMQAAMQMQQGNQPGGPGGL